MPSDTLVQLNSARGRRDVGIADLLDIQRLYRALLVLASCLLPFSTSAESIVFSFGVPPLAALLALYFYDASVRPVLPAPQHEGLAVGSALMLAILLSWSYTPVPVEAGARVAVNLVGFGLFIFLLSPAAPGATLPDLFERIRIVSMLLVLFGAVLASYFIQTFVRAALSRGVATALWSRVVGGASSLPWGATNVIASLFILPIFLAFHRSKCATARLVRIGYAGAGTLMTVALVVTASRGAIVSVAVGCLILAGLTRPLATLKMVAGLALLAGLLNLADRVLRFDFLSGSLWPLISARFDTSDLIHGPDAGRRELMNAYFAYIAEQPILGTGYYSALYVHGITAHNVVLTTLAERGLVGLVLSSLVILAAAFVLVRGLLLTPAGELRDIFRVLTAGGAASLLHLLVEDANISYQYIVFSWTALALVFTCGAVWIKASCPGRS